MTMENDEKPFIDFGGPLEPGRCRVRISIPDRSVQYEGSPEGADAATAAFYELITPKTFAQVVKHMRAMLDQATSRGHSQSMLLRAMMTPAEWALAAPDGWASIRGWADKCDPMTGQIQRVRDKPPPAVPPATRRTRPSPVPAALSQTMTDALARMREHGRLVRLGYGFWMAPGGTLDDRGLPTGEHFTAGTIAALVRRGLASFDDDDPYTVKATSTREDSPSTSVSEQDSKA